MAVDRVAVGGVADVVPDRRAVVVRRRGVDVVAEELGGQVVLRRAACITRLTAVVSGERGPRQAGVISENAVPGQSAWSTTPTSCRSLSGPIALVRNGVSNAL